MERFEEDRISNIPQLRVENLLSIMRVVFYEKTITRKEIGEITGLAPNTISQLTGKLIRKGVLAIQGKEKSTGGRQSDFLNFNSDAFYSIGISVGVSKCRGIITDMYGLECVSVSKDVDTMNSNEELEKNIHTYSDRESPGNR